VTAGPTLVSAAAVIDLDTHRRVETQRHRPLPALDAGPKLFSGQGHSGVYFQLGIAPR